MKLKDIIIKSIYDQDRVRGYPTPSEWDFLVRRAKEVLSQDTSDSIPYENRNRLHDGDPKEGSK